MVVSNVVSNVASDCDITNKINSPKYSGRYHKPDIVPLLKIDT